MADSSHNNGNVAQGPGSSLAIIGAQLSNSTTDEPRGMGHLPDEVLIKIAQNCQGQHKVATLRDLCKVSTRMDSIARQELYRAVSVDTWPRVRRLWRTIDERPALGQYIVELELLVPGYSCTTTTTETVERLDAADFSMLYSLFLGILRGTSNLRKLNMMLFGLGQSTRIGGPQQNLYHEFIMRLCKMVRQSQSSGSTSAVLPLLEKVRLGADANWKDPTVYRRLGLAQPLLFLPFLDLSSMSSLESIDDSGVWPGNRHDLCLGVRNYSVFASQTHPYQQIKSVVLRESNCLPMDVMDICDVFPDMQIFFCQNRLKGGVYDTFDAGQLGLDQRDAAFSEKRYLTDSLGKLQNLQALALVPFLPGLLTQIWKQEFSSPSGFLKFTGLPRLTSLATLVSAFASPDGETTGLLTPGPMEVLPSSLRSLQLIVDHWTCGSLAALTPLDENWFQPREAALQFLGALAGICAGEFPALRQVEYIWAVDRFHAESGGDVLHAPRPCDGTHPLCCDMHARIQALSPDEDYTSRAEGIVSPFKDRFDGLAAAFNEANVVFRVVELKEYSDFYAHWQGSRR